MIVAKTDDYTIHTEDFDGLCFMHCDVHRWSKSVKRSLDHAFMEFCEQCKEPKHVGLAPENVKLKKFLALFGFQHFGNVVGTDQNTYEVWRK